MNIMLFRSLILGTQLFRNLILQTKCYSAVRYIEHNVIQKFQQDIFSERLQDAP